MKNQNTKQQLENMKIRVLENLRMLQLAPAVSMQEIPPGIAPDISDDDEPDPEVRISQQERDNMVEPDNEFYEDEYDNDHDELEI